MAATYTDGETELVIDTVEQANALEALGWELVDGERPEVLVAEGDHAEAEPFDPTATGVTGAEVVEELERILADADDYVERAHAEVRRIVDVERTREHGLRREVKQFVDDQEAAASEDAGEQ